MQSGIIGTMRTREFASRLSSGCFDDGGTVAVVSTSYSGDAATIRSVAFDRGLASAVLVLEYDDVENPKRLTAMSAEMAGEAVAFLRGCDSADARFLMVCDGGFSRSAALCAAWERMSGRSDVDWWVQPEKYAPNLLVYRRVLEAGGIDVTDDQVERLGELKEAMLGLKISKADGNSESGEESLAHRVRLSNRQRQMLLSLGIDGPARIAELQERLAVPAPSAYNLLRELESLGLAEKGPDGRRRLTAEGEAASCQIAIGARSRTAGAYDKRDLPGRSVRGFKKEHFYLSNFFEVPVELDGIVYRNSEAAYQAGRCRIDAEKREFAELDAGVARKRAHHETETRDDWEDFRFDHMRRVVSAKFHQNLDLAWELVHLDGELIELNDWHDNYWGDCRCPDCKDISGQNMLGRILMGVRKELRDGIARSWPRAQHEMKLAPGPFEKVASGAKTIEIRLYDEKRRKVQTGDAIVFFPLEGFRPPIGVVVTGVAVYPSFEDLFGDVDLAKCGYAPEEIENASAADMDEYYSAEVQEKYSAVAVSFAIPRSDRRLDSPLPDKNNEFCWRYDVR